MTKGHVFVPLLNGRVVGFPLDKEVFTPWYYQSYGRAKVPPLVTAESVVWATDTGHLYIGGADELAIRSRLETGSEIASPPAYRKPYVYVATLSGEVFAIEEATGRKRWKYATGYTINRDSGDRRRSGVRHVGRAYAAFDRRQDGYVGMGGTECGPIRGREPQPRVRRR